MSELTSESSALLQRLIAIAVAVAAAATFAVFSALSATAAPAPVPVAAGPAPAPHIISSFAASLTGPRQVLPSRPVVSVPVRADVDGCDRNYGDSKVCVPKVLPGGQKDLCAYLAAHKITGLRVRGTDARRVDLNRNGVVCD